ncbi:MAG: hypothetical protein AB1Z38_09500 [Desulfotignum sp.]
MKLSACIPQRISKFAIGLMLVAAALAMIIIGVTILPIIGLVLAVPILALAAYVFKLHFNDQCEIDPSEDN